MQTLKASCSNCHLRNMCLPAGLKATELASLEEIIRQPHPMQPGQALYTPGKPFEYVYIVHSGSVKSYTSTVSGDQQIVGFHWPGDLLGLDGVSDNEFTCTAEAMETTTVCEISFNTLEKLMSSSKTLQHQLHRLMGKELVTDQQLMLQLGKMNSEQRVAMFLLSVSHRLHVRGFSAHEFILPMTRLDIGNYLGLAVETVSRQFSLFQEQDLLQVIRKHVKIKNLDALNDIVGQEVKFAKSKRNGTASVV